MAERFRLRLMKTTTHSRRSHRPAFTLNSLRFRGAAVLLLSIAIAAAVPIERVSVSSSEEEANSFSTSGGLPNLSDDARFVVFTSSATNLVAGDTNGGEFNEGLDVFVRDVLNGTTTRVSVNSAGMEARGIEDDPPGSGNGIPPFSSSASMSADGRWIAFRTTARNFVPPEDINVPEDFSVGYVVLHDRLMGTTIGVNDFTYRDTSRPISSQRRAKGSTPAISADGNVVAFLSIDGAFVPEDTNTQLDLFVWTRTTGAYERVSVTTGGGQVSANNYSTPRLSADGQLVVFSTTAPLVPGNDVAGTKVFLRDRTAGTTELISLDSSGVAVTGGSPSISRDGRYVAFTTSAKLVDADTNGTVDVYVRDRSNGAIALCSRKPDGSLFGGHTQTPFISGNGRYVAFIGPGQHVSGGFTVLINDLFVLDRETGIVVEAGVGIAGDSDSDSMEPTLSNNGQFLIFLTSGTNLVANDTNFVTDVFLRDRAQEESSNPTASPPFVRLTVGESSVVSIHPPADVANPDSHFQSAGSHDENVVEVTPAGVLTPSGSNPAQFTFNAVAAGSTVVRIEFTNGPAGPPKTVSIDVTVAGAADTGANITQTADAFDPVDTRNGEYYSIESVPMRLGGPMPLSLAIYYASRLSVDARLASTLGENRLHSFETKMTTPQATRRDIVSNRGRVISFQKTGRTWTLIGRTDIPYRLVESGADFILGDPHSQRMWTYDGTTGRLLKIEDGRGNIHTLTYVSDLLATVADALGRTLTFTYTSGKLTRVTDHTGRHADFAHTGAVLTSMADPLGHTTTYAHNADERLTSFTRPEGNVPFTQAYTDGRVTSQTERTTDTGTLAYAGAVTTATNPAGGTIVDTYAATGELAVHTDEAGKPIAMTSDTTGRRSSVSDREGDTTRIVYHALSGKPAVITNAEGRTVTMAYKPRVLNGVTFFDLASVTFTDGTRESYIRDAFGNVLSRTDRAGKKWKFTYNTRGQTLTATNPLGGVSVFAYDAAGNLASRKDPDTDATTFAYDALNRPITVTRPGGATMAFTYDAADRLRTTTDERGKVTTFDYDDNNRLTTLTDPDTKTTTYAYDVLDRVASVTDRTGATGSVTYNSRQLLSSATDRNGNATTFAYDARQRPTGRTDAGGKTWTMGFDNEGLLVSGANPVDPPGVVKRNNLGRVVEVSDALGNTAQVTRDAMQRVVGSFDPLGRATAFTYDKRGLLASATEQGTGTAKYDRDPLGSLSKITDPNGNAWVFAYTKAGRRAGMTDPLRRSSSHTYDARGRRAVTTFADATTLTRTYDAASNVTRRLFTDGTDLTFTYDNLNRLTATNEIAFTYDAEGRITDSAQTGGSFGATYDAGGRLLTVTSPRNGGAFTVTYAYDTRNRLVSVGDNFSSATVGFTYDDAGRLLTMTRSNNVTRTHTYDAAGRLTRIQEAGPVAGTVLDLKYALNAAGEVASVDYTAPLLPGVVAATEPLAFDKASQIATAGFAYDARARLTAAPGGAFAWDGASRLKTAAGVALTYNGLGDVITRTAAAATTRFFYNYALGLHPIVAEKTEGGAFVRHYVWTPGGRLLYAIDAASGQPVFYHFDRIGSTLALSDHTGAVADTYAYGPYGEPLARTGTSTQPFTYVGALGVRAEGALHQMRARYYDPATARFLSPDPLWPSLAKPKRLNPYEYAAQSPGEFVDPRGMYEYPGVWRGYDVRGNSERRAQEYTTERRDDERAWREATDNRSICVRAAPPDAADAALSAGLTALVDGLAVLIEDRCRRGYDWDEFRLVSPTSAIADLLGAPNANASMELDGETIDEREDRIREERWKKWLMDSADQALIKPKGAGSSNADEFILLPLLDWLYELWQNPNMPAPEADEPTILDEIEEVIVIS